ncbi:MAG: nucleotidyltransferase family protein, partial [Acidimicrobiales bacterium]|nr:nucleotidyltransferase family protein [Acidimicrobiales bacterium]
GVLAVAAGAGAVELPDPVAEDLHRRHHDALVWAMTLEIELLAVVDRLEGAGIEPVVLKGPALAHLDAPDPALRTFADLDLLVPADQLPDAVAMLVADGAIRRVAERRPGWDRRFAKSVTLQRPDGLELDLHRTLVDGAHGGRIPTRDLHRDRAGFELAGRSLWALAPVHRALHSAL